MKLCSRFNRLTALALFLPWVSQAQLSNPSPTNLTWQVTTQGLTFSWPADYIGWILEAQTNAPGQGLGANWTTVPGTELTNVFTIPVDPANGLVCFRLLRPGELQLASGDGFTVPHLAARSDGTTWLTWYEPVASEYRLRLQRLDAAGLGLLGTNGVEASPVDQDSWVMDYDLANDSGGNAILAWSNTKDFTLHAQRFGALGVARWGASGIVLSTAGSSAYAPHCLTYANGDSAIAWLEQTATSPATSTVSVVRLRPSGQAAWNTPFAVQIPPRSQATPQLLQGAGDSVILLWVENSGFNAPGDLYAQQVDGTGSAVWTNKVKINGTARLPFRSLPALVADGSGGLYATWTTDLGGNWLAGRVQHIDQNGALLWAADGQPVSTSTTTMQIPQAITYLPTQQRAVVAWKETDSTQGVAGINAQAFGSLADPLWPDTGLMIVDASPDVTGIVGALRTAASGAALFFSEDHGFGQTTEHGALLPAQVGATPNKTVFSIITSGKLHPTVSNLVNGGYWFVWEDDRGGIFGAFWNPQ